MLISQNKEPVIVLRSRGGHVDEVGSRMVQSSQQYQVYMCKMTMTIPL